MSDIKERPSRKTIIISALMCFLAAGLLGAMHLGMSQPFNGVAMRGHILTVDEFQKITGRDMSNFLVPVYSSVPRTDHDLTKPAFYLEPGDEVWVTGIIYDWYQIIRGQEHFWVYGRYISTEGRNK